MHCESSLVTTTVNLLVSSLVFLLHGSSRYLADCCALSNSIADSHGGLTTPTSASVLLHILGFFLLGTCLFSVYEWAVHYFIYHGSYNLRIGGYHNHLHLKHHSFPEKLSHVSHTVVQQYLWIVMFCVCVRVVCFPGTYFPSPIPSFLSTCLPCPHQGLLSVLVSGNIFALFLHEIAHLHAHGHPFLIQHLKFLEPCRKYHSYHHYSSEYCKVAFGLVTPWLDLISGHLPPHPSASPFHVYSKQFNSSYLRSITHHLMRTPVPIPYLHWICMYYLSQDGDF